MVLRKENRSYSTKNWFACFIRENMPERKSVTSWVSVFFVQLIAWYNINHQNSFLMDCSLVEATQPNLPLPLPSDSLRPVLEE